MKGLHHKIAKILESEDFSLWQKLNSFRNRFYVWIINTSYKLGRYKLET